MNTTTSNDNAAAAAVKNAENQLALARAELRRAESATRSRGNRAEILRDGIPGNPEVERPKFERAADEWRKAHEVESAARERILFCEQALADAKKSARDFEKLPVIPSCNAEEVFADYLRGIDAMEAARTRRDKIQSEYADLCSKLNSYSSTRSEILEGKGSLKDKAAALALLDSTHEVMNYQKDEMEESLRDASEFYQSQMPPLMAYVGQQDVDLRAAAAAAHSNLRAAAHKIPVWSLLLELEHSNTRRQGGSNNSDSSRDYLITFENLKGPIRKQIDEIESQASSLSKKIQELYAAAEAALAEMGKELG